MAFDYDSYRCGRLQFQTRTSWPPLLDLSRPDMAVCGAFRRPSTRQFSVVRTLRLEASRRKRAYSRHVRERLASEYWGGAPGQESGMRRLLTAVIKEGLPAVRRYCEFSKPSMRIKPAFIDVGAARYEGPDRCHAADVALLLGCENDVTVDALEPLYDEMKRTQAVTVDTLQRHFALDAGTAADCVRWHRVAASNVSALEMPMRGRSNQASLSAHIPEQTRSIDYNIQGDVSRTTPTIRLDDFARQHDLGPILLLKIDTEGHDYEVLVGALGLLEANLVAALTFEVAGQMNKDFFAIHKEGGPPPPWGQALAEPNLHSMVGWLERLGYDSYFLGSRSLVPLGREGGWWDDAYEVCITRPQLPCWYDVLALARAFPAAPQTLRVALLGAWEPVSDADA